MHNHEIFTYFFSGKAFRIVEEAVFWLATAETSKRRRFRYRLVAVQNLDDLQQKGETDDTNIMFSFFNSDAFFWMVGFLCLFLLHAMHDPNLSF